MADCRVQGCEGEIDLSFQDLGGLVQCPKCGAYYEVEYDESYSKEGGEICYFWLGALVDEGEREDPRETKGDLDYHNDREEGRA